jgi:hypothetical protein
MRRFSRPITISGRSNCRRPFLSSRHRHVVRSGRLRLRLFYTLLPPDEFRSPCRKRGARLGWPSSCSRIYGSPTSMSRVYRHKMNRIEPMGRGNVGRAVAAFLGVSRLALTTSDCNSPTTPSTAPITDLKYEHVIPLPITADMLVVLEFWNCYNDSPTGPRWSSALLSDSGRARRLSLPRRRLLTVSGKQCPYDVRQQRGRVDSQFHV